MFKQRFKIEETGQEITCALIETETEYKEFHIKVSSNESIKGVDLAHCLLEYAHKIYEESKPSDALTEEP